jgi:hypothetical protein
MAAGDGLISMTPTSIAHSGTSASINSDGGVDFSAVTSLSLNGVFTGDYDNYLIVVEQVGAGNDLITMRMRSAGTDASGSNYASQRLDVDGGTIGGTRSTSQTSAQVMTVSTNRNGHRLHVYGPALAQPTAYRGVSVRGANGAYIDDFAGTHSLSTSYDGLTFISTGSSTGTVHVFGYEE